MIRDIIILRAEFICVIMLLFLLNSSIHYKVGKDGSSFYRLWTLAMIHVVCDMCSVILLNAGMDFCYSGITKAVLFVMCMSAVLFAREFFLYTVKLCMSAGRTSAYGKYSAGFIFLYMIAILILPFEHCGGTGTDYASGPMVVLTFGTAFFFLAWATAKLFLSRNIVDRHVMITLYPMLAVMILVEVVQLSMPELQFTGACVALITVSVFFTMENPEETIKTKATLDLFTGLRSRNAFEEDISVLEKKFEEGSLAEKEIGFVFCDINGLKAVNDQYGHQTGDDYIRMVAIVLLEELGSAKNVYRFGGDEFLAVYRGVDESVICSEIENANKRCEVLNEQHPYNMSVAIGYEISEAKYNSLSEVLYAADHDMYDKKWKMKHGSLPKITPSEDGIDKTGLTDRIFEAFALTDDKNCLYLCNMATNITRVSKSFVTNFRLPSQYINDIFMLWEENVHPDDRERYHNEIEDIFNGRKDMYNISYMAKNKDGVYVKCISKGNVLHGEGTDPDLFAGVMIFTDEQRKMDR